MPPAAVRPRFFADATAWRRWLEANHERAAEVWVGFWKRDSGRPSITWPEAVDGALCFGWIDGVRYSIDARAYRIRFTPRRAGSTWSQVNLRRMEALLAAGLVHPRGRAVFEARDPARTARYSFERAAAELSPAETAALRADAAAWADWSRRPPSYRKACTHWITSAVKPETRARRFAQLVACSAAATEVPPLRWRPARGAATVSRPSRGRLARPPTRR